MGTTRRGLEVSTDDPDVIGALDDFTDRLAGIRTGTDLLVPVLDEHGDVATLRLAAAMLFLYGQTDAATATALDHLDAARRDEGALVERERATLAALDRWSVLDHLGAIVAFEQLLARWPRDILALKALEFLYYVRGQQHLGPRFLAVVDALAPANPGDADVLAVHAFAAELCGQLDRAEELADASLDADPRTSWAHHALAHVFIARGDQPAAVDRLAGYLPVWQSSGRVIHAHNAWHLAVARLDRLDLAGADEVAQAHIWGFQPDTPGEQIDTISYLWRAEMAGAAVDERRWHDVADHVAARAGACVFPFLSAHHGYALARAGRLDELTALRASVATRAAVDDLEARQVWQPLGVAVVDACIAQGHGDLATAAGLLGPVVGSVAAVGGSDAQCDLFRLAYLDALIGTGRRDDARRWWSRMTAFKTAPSPLDESLRARVDAAP